MRKSTLAIILMTLISAACQQQGGAHPIESIDDQEEATGVFESRVESAMNRILVPAQLNCAIGEPLTSENEVEDFLEAPLGNSALAQCFISSIDNVFDVPAEGRNTCGGLSTVRKISICLISGSFVRDVHLENGENVPPMLWKDPSRAMDAMTQRFAGAEAVLCYQSGVRGHRLRQCVLQGILRRLDVSEGDAEKCDRFSEQLKHDKCLGEAAVTRYLESKAWEKQI